MRTLLAQSPLLTLFVVAAAGFLLGRIKIAGFGLGVAAVLFAGLAVGAYEPRTALPELVSQFGLVLFVYTVGVSSGPGFFASLRARGLRVNAATAGLLALGALLTLVAGRALGLGGGASAGLFAGSLTNTPALAAVVEGLPKEAATKPVVAYSVTYPFGVLGVLAAIYVTRRLFERRGAEAVRAESPQLVTVTARVTNPDATLLSLAGARRQHGFHVLFGRYRRDGVVAVVNDDMAVRIGDLVSVVGVAPEVSAVAAWLGEVSDEHIELDRSTIDFRRMFVSNPEVTEKPIAELALPQRHGAVITRVRRGDVEILPDETTVLELGDRVRVVAPRDRLDAVAKLLGDSYRALGEVDVITFGLGVALGLLLGQIALPLPTGGAFKLGAAGGPLIAGLVLGRLGRTGPLVWTLPFSAGLTLRQLGLVLFLAGVGTRSGEAFAATLKGGTALPLIGAGALVTTVVAVLILAVGRFALKLPFPLLAGVLSGAQTQAAAVAFSCDQTKSDQPNVGYASVYPVATIAKIFLAQLLVGLSQTQ